MYTHIHLRIYIYIYIYIYVKIPDIITGYVSLERSLKETIGHPSSAKTHDLSYVNNYAV